MRTIWRWVHLQSKEFSKCSRSIDIPHILAGNKFVPDKSPFTPSPIDSFELSDFRGKVAGASTHQ